MGVLFDVAQKQKNGKETVEKVKTLQIEQVKLSELNTHPKNARQGDVGAIVESLEAHGQYKPIIVQKSTNNVLAGNHTLQAARALGWEEIAATFVDVDDDQALRILIVDNRVSDLATYDDEVLVEVLKSLAEDEFLLEGTGFEGDDLDDLLFRLEGSEGFLSEALSSTERKEMYEASGIRSIVLPYPEKEYEELQELIKEVRGALGVESNSEVFSALVREAHANH